MRIICCYILAYWETFTLIKGMKNVIVIIWLSRYSSRILKTMEKKYKIEYTVKLVQYMKLRSSHPEVFLEKGVLKICSKFTGKRPCQSAVSIKFLCKFIAIALWHWCSPVNLLHIFRTPFLKNTSGRLFLETFVTYFIWKYWMPVCTFRTFSSLSSSLFYSLLLSSAKPPALIWSFSFIKSAKMKYLWKISMSIVCDW